MIRFSAVLSIRATLLISSLVLIKILFLLDKDPVDGNTESDVENAETRKLLFIDVRDTVKAIGVEMDWDFLELTDKNIHRTFVTTTVSQVI